jgi:hypothetical protein
MVLTTRERLQKTSKTLEKAPLLSGSEECEVACTQRVNKNQACLRLFLTTSKKTKNIILL